LQPHLRHRRRPRRPRRRAGCGLDQRASHLQAHLPVLGVHGPVAESDDHRPHLSAQPALFGPGRPCRSAAMPRTEANRRLRGFFARLDENQSGVTIIEFAYSLPILMVLGFTGVETANLAVANMRVSQFAMTVADNLSRAKQSVPLGLPQLREVDINDALLGAKIQGGDSLAILNNGR